MYVIGSRKHEHNDIKSNSIKEKGIAIVIIKSFCNQFCLQIVYKLFVFEEVQYRNTSISLCANVNGTVEKIAMNAKQ